MMIWLGVATLAVATPTTYLILQDNGLGSVMGKDAVKKASAVEQKKIMNHILNMVSDSKKPSDIENYLSKNISKLSNKNANEAFYSLTYSLTLEQENMTNAYQAVSNELLFAYEDNEFKAGKNMDTSKVKDYAVKGYLDELTRQFLYLEDDGSNLKLKVDYEKIEKKYENYFEDGLKTLMTIKIQEQDKPYFNADMTQYNMKEMLERILYIEGKRASWENTIYHNEVQAYQEHIYADFFGVSQESYFEKKDDKLVMKDSVKEELGELLTEYSNSFMGNDIVAYMESLESNKWEKGKESEVVLKMMYDRFGKTSTVQAPFETITAPTDLEVDNNE